MPQNKIVDAFRKRLKKAGYFDISIKHQYDSIYQVSACEPLAWQEVHCYISEKRMQNKFYRRKKKGNYL